MPPTSREQILQKLESLERAGVTHLPKPRKKPTKVGVPPSGGEAPPQPAVAAIALPVSPPAPAPLFDPPAAPPIPAAERPTLLEIIQTEVAGCTRCTELATTRTQTVFGTGNPSARLMFVGEAPGADEDRQGKPFVGRAGQLLTKIIEACRLTRDEVYIANVLKCRPPDNRTPLPDEVLNCRGYLDRQIAIIRPEAICCLGLTAAKALLNTEQSMGRLRGKFHLYSGIPVLCTYHPAYLLRNPAAKRDVWEDMKTLMRRLGVELG
jgi:uracil-DNA glycosylase family 4